MYDLLNAYRYQRRPSMRGYFPTATQAIEAARRDVANGTRRYASSPWAKQFPAVSWDKEKPGIAYVDKPERCGLREVGRVAPEARRSSIWDRRGDCGWYTDPYGDVFTDGTGLCYGVVYQLPGRDGKARFVPGYQFGGTDSGPTLDFGDIREDDARGYGYSTNPRDMDSALDAARRADDMAKAAAEAEREYQTAWAAGVQWADATREIGEVRQSIKADLATRKAIRADMARAGVPMESREWSRACAMVRASVTSSLEALAELRDKRDKLASGDWESLIFYPSDDLRAAFNDGAGEAVI